jgi:hypothetical protein
MRQRRRRSNVAGRISGVRKERTRLILWRASCFQDDIGKVRLCSQVSTIVSPGADKLDHVQALGAVTAVIHSLLAFSGHVGS